MVFWTIAIALTAAACAALYYAAAGRRVNAEAAGADLVSTHHRLQLRELEADIAAGRLGEAEGLAAKGELAREVLKQQGEGNGARSAGPGGPVVALSVAAIAIIAISTYWLLGNPDVPSAPLAERGNIPELNMSVTEAVARIEQQLTLTPDDVRGWAAIAPVYVEMGRYADATRAYRRVLELSEPTADAETDLAEALLLQNGGVVAGEPMELLQSAAARDPSHVRSRFYLAGEATRVGDFAAAESLWEELIGLAQGDEPWLETARSGLAVSQAGLLPEKVPPDDDAAVAIRGMVEGLHERLMSEGGTIEEWTQLVRSRLVLEEKDAAQAAYDAAVAAYPDAAERTELDTLAGSMGLVVKGNG
jgi:cytochrome c-type biogenesis protein CcmH